MFLVSLHLTFQLDPETTTPDRERVLRSIRDRIKNNHGNRLTTRTDDDAAVALAFFDSSLSKAESRAEAILEEIENYSQARIDSQTVQFYEWFEGAFEELPSAEPDSSVQKPSFRKSVSLNDVVYEHDDFEEKRKLNPGSNRPSLPSRKYTRT
jgi:hypothetical protein